MCEVSTIPGLAELWDQTTGDDRICVAVVDGPVNDSHPVFAGANLARLEGVWPQESRESPKAAHGTHVASIIFGQHDGPISGVAPGCRGLSVPAFSDQRPKTSQLDVARGIELAVEAGAKVINVSAGQLSPSGEAEDVLARAVRFCQERNVLVVAAAGNDGCFCMHVPAALPSVIAVGALDDADQPLAMSNWGSAYRHQGIMAPGENILGAIPGGGTARKSGTSLATPIVAGVAALLLSLQIRAGQDPDPLGVGAALLESADPCELDDPGKCIRFLTGKLNIGRAVSAVTTDLIQSANQPVKLSEGSCGCGGVPAAAQALTSADITVPDPEAAAAVPATRTPEPKVVVSADEPAKVPWTPLVYAIGILDYDFGTEARRDTFKQTMASVTVGGTVLPPNPYDTRQIVDHLGAHPSEAKALIWTLKLELTPIYAIEPIGPYAANVYELLTRLLGSEVADADAPDFIERVAIPGRLSGRTVKLFSGQIVPVVEVEHQRGLYGWDINRLVAAALEAAHGQPGGPDDAAIRNALRELLTRIYYDLRNLGTISRDRALNFAATNAFQAAQTISAAVAAGLALDKIDVEKSPICRIDSDCWDVKLRFFDPENSRRAKKVFHFTIDVSDTLPVTLGDVRTWSET